MLNFVIVNVIHAVCVVFLIVMLTVIVWHVVVTLSIIANKHHTQHKLHSPFLHSASCVVVPNAVFYCCYAECLFAESRGAKIYLQDQDTML